MADYIIEVAALGVTTTVIVVCGVLGVAAGLYIVKSILDFFRG